MLGGLLNLGIYRLAWQPRRVSPWSAPPEGGSSRGWVDRLPVLGWFFLQRESAWHGRAFWVRPLCIELLTGIGLAALYYFEVEQAGTFPVAGLRPAPETLWAQFASHALLFSLLVVATFIDFDEQTIPDAITIPGTLAGLAVAAALPIARPLIAVPVPFPAFGVQIELLHLASPNPWPSWLNGSVGLALALLGFWAWWLAILPWTWTTRRGLGKAVSYFFVSIARRISLPLVLIAAIGAASTAGIWLAGGTRWESLLSAIAGVVFGGGLIWAVRIIGTRALGQEAMGFGDVTLMAMIGAFTGWQATLMAFFLAPFAAVIISVSQWLLTGRKDIAFGPYLSLATIYLVLRWQGLWNDSVQPIFSLGWFVPAMTGVCLVLMGGMLLVLRRFRQWRESSQAEMIASGPGSDEGTPPPDGSGGAGGTVPD